MADELWSTRLGARQLDADLPTPLYHQIYLVIRERIRSGLIPAQSVLPGEQELAALFEVSRITIARALNELAVDGFVTRARGRGTIVTPGAAIPVVKGSFDTLIESLRLMGLETQVELLDVAMVAADAEVARQLDLPIEAQVQRAVRRRKLAGEPFSYLVTFVPGAIAAGYTQSELASQSLLSLLERAGSAAYEAEQWITAVAAEPSVASALSVAVGSPLLKIERVMRDMSGHPVQLIYAHYRPDRFQYHVKTKRSRRASGPSGWRNEG